jgi:hypothetical protein
MSIDSFRHSDAYLARVDEAGRPLWENTYSNGGRRKIRSVARMESGNLAIAGSDSRDGWLALVSPDGRQLWERCLGNDLDIAVAALSDDRLALVGFESTGSGAAKDHQQHVTTWIIDSSGSMVAAPLLCRAAAGKISASWSPCWLPICARHPGRNNRLAVATTGLLQAKKRS